MWHWGEILVDIKMHLFCYQKVGTRSRSVSVHSDLSYDASHAHMRGRGDNSKKLTFFCLSPRGLWRTQDNQNASEIELVSLVWTLGSPWWLAKKSQIA